jgi:hypothetical protein
MQDFTTPQPFNVEIGPDVEPPASAGVAAPSVPVVAQEITPDPDLYPPRRHGVMHGGIR